MITLNSDSLNSKWGFEDGDILDDLLYEAGLGPADRPENMHLSFAHETLARLVEMHLLPLLPDDVYVKRISTIHNPIRAQGCNAPCGISVDVTRDEALKTAREVAESYANKRR